MQLTALSAPSEPLRPESPCHSRTSTVLSKMVKSNAVLVDLASTLSCRFAPQTLPNALHSHHHRQSQTALLGQDRRWCRPASLTSQSSTTDLARRGRMMQFVTRLPSTVLQCRSKCHRATKSHRQRRDARSEPHSIAISYLVTYTLGRAASIPNSVHHCQSRIRATHHVKTRS